MGTIEHRWRVSIGRRRALGHLAAFLAASPLLNGQQDPANRQPHRRVPGLAELTTAFDFEPICRANMLASAYDNMAQGEGSEFTLRRNREAFEWVDIVPGTPVPEAMVDLSSRLLGVDLKFPVFVAPSGGQGVLHPDGEIGMYRGATAAGTLMAVANPTTVPHAKIAAAATGARWNQFYPIPDVQLSVEVIQQFLGLGTQAIVITVDQQVATFERGLHNRNLGGIVRDPATIVRGSTNRGRTGREGSAATPPFELTSAYGVSNVRLWYNWHYVNELRKAITVPVLIKGVLTAEDATECVRQGVDGIIVSNHGGRSMDYGPSTLEVLPEIVGAVAGRLPVIVDGGFRRGADVFKALALGANAVALGRATRWGLGAFGAAGVQRLLEIVQRELVETAAAAGCRTLKDVGPRCVKEMFT